jgi:hypothetical protein
MPIDNGINQEFLALKVTVNSESYFLILYFLIADFEKFLILRNNKFIIEDQAYFAVKYGFMYLSCVIVVCQPTKDLKKKKVK